MTLVNLTLRAANDFVVRHHRHHGTTRGAKFAIGAEVDGKLVGVAIVGRPVARRFDDGKTAEVTRLCSDGTDNVCSFLYAKAKRADQALALNRVITYTLASENGSSLRAAGATCIGKAGGGAWGRKDRPREVKAPTEPKLLWEL